MKSKRDNRIVLDLNKVQWGRFYYRNQHGQTRNTLPEPYTITIHGDVINEDEPVHFHPEYPDETALDRAKRLGILDWWTPEVYFKVAANAAVIYTGDKAVSMNKAWREKIFGDKK